MSEATSSTTDCIDVLDVHRFDERALERYMIEHVEDFEFPLTVHQFQGGMSNPTFRLVDGNGKVVLRKSRLVSFAINMPSTVSIVLFQRSMGRMFRYQRPLRCVRTIRLSVLLSTSWSTCSGAFSWTRRSQS